LENSGHRKASENIEKPKKNGSSPMRCQRQT